MPKSSDKTSVPADGPPAETLVITSIADDDTSAEESPEVSETAQDDDEQADADEHEDAPTLDDAFFALARALLPHLEENMPMYTHVQECMGVYANGNTTIAWGRVLAILEGVLGTVLHPN